MIKQIYINLPVSALARATAFYQAIGFTLQPHFSNEVASGMKWSDEIFVMLLTHDFYKKFIGSGQVADMSKTSGALFALTLDSKEEVHKFVDTAIKNGGSAYQVDMGMSEDMMLSYEVLDPDGNHWEPAWMSPDFDPKS
jgi:uncharacterized protein